MEKLLLKELVREFISFCDRLLSEGKITEHQYEEMVKKKKAFLDSQ